ncbi:MAG TPA: hypothetical protein VFD98_10370 [Terracidiphilus sp.]|nr:hypothetical protein [Terracidiphilus sp.]
MRALEDFSTSDGEFAIDAVEFAATFGMRSAFFWQPAATRTMETTAAVESATFILRFIYASEPVGFMPNWLVNERNLQLASLRAARK